jgi:ankyrin repeat protein
MLLENGARKRGRTGRDLGQCSAAAFSDLEWQYDIMSLLENDSIPTRPIRTCVAGSASEGNDAIVNFLLQRGADVNRKHTRGYAFR